MIVEMKVVTRLQDNGDGGWTMYLYNSTEDMVNDHPLMEDGELTYEEVEVVVLGEDDPYENGYIGSETIMVNVDNGVATLAQSVSLHVGQ